MNTELTDSQYWKDAASSDLLSHKVGPGPFEWALFEVLGSFAPVLPRTHIIAMVKNMVGGGDEVDGDTPLMESGTHPEVELVSV